MKGVPTNVIKAWKAFRVKEDNTFSTKRWYENKGCTVALIFFVHEDTTYAIPTKQIHDWYAISGIDYDKKWGEKEEIRSVILDELSGNEQYALRHQPEYENKEAWIKRYQAAFTDRLKTSETNPLAKENSMSKVIAEEVGTVQTREVYVQSHGDVPIAEMTVDQILSEMQSKKDAVKSLVKQGEDSIPVVAKRIKKYKKSIKALRAHLETR